MLNGCRECELHRSWHYYCGSQMALKCDNGYDFPQFALHPPPPPPPPPPRILFDNVDNLMSLYVYSVHCGSIVDEIMFLHVIQQGINWCQFAHAFPDWDTPAWHTTRYYLVISRSKFPWQWALTIDLHCLETIHYIRNHYHEVKMIGVFTR